MDVYFLSLIACIVCTVATISQWVVMYYLWSTARNFPACPKRYRNQRTQDEKAILEERVRSQDNAFAFVGREIHDHVNQLMALLHLELARLQVKDDPDNNRHYQSIKQLTMLTSKSLLSISKSLNTAVILEYGLDVMVTEEIKRLSNTFGTAIKVNYNFELNRMDDQVQLHIFRIFQEATRNAIQHGKATAIEWEVLLHNNRILVKVADNGSGFDPERKREKRQSQGLMNMETRAAFMGGDYTIRSIPGEGTQVLVEIPCDLDSISQ